MKLLLNEMYPAALAAALRQVGVDASTATELGLAGRSDPDVFAAAAARKSAVLTENTSETSPTGSCTSSNNADMYDRPRAN